MIKGFCQIFCSIHHLPNLSVYRIVKPLIQVQLPSSRFQFPEENIWVLHCQSLVLPYFGQSPLAFAWSTSRLPGDWNTTIAKAWQRDANISFWHHARLCLKTREYSFLQDETPRPSCAHIISTIAQKALRCIPPTYNYCWFLSLCSEVATWDDVSLSHPSRSRPV